MEIFDAYDGQINVNNYFEDCETIKNKPLNSLVKQTALEKLKQQEIKGNLSKKQIQEGGQKKIEFATNICTELSELKRARFIEEKKRQQLRESSQELKALEAKLRTAYIHKALTAQIADNISRAEEEKLMKKKENSILEEARRSNEGYQKIAIEEEQKKKMLHRKDLLEQIEEIQQKKAKRYEEFLKEKHSITSLTVGSVFCTSREMRISPDLLVLQKLTSSGNPRVSWLEEMKEKLQRKLKFKEDMSDFIQMQKEWKAKLVQDTREENQRIIEYLQKKESIAKDLENKRKLEIKAREELSDKIGEEVFQQEVSKRQRQDLLEDLYMNEKRALVEEKIRKDIEESLRKRIAARMQLQEQQEIALQKRLEEKEEDRIFQEEQLRLFAERDKLEQLSDEKRRKKMLEHRREMKDVLDDRQRRRENQYALMLEERKQQLQEEQRKQQHIEEERIRMLKEHAHAIIGFLPPGVLRESDREHLPLPPKPNASC